MLATSLQRPSRIVVDYATLANNFLALQSAAGPLTMVVPTVKADAYGHGAVRTARACCDAGAKYLAVASISEALSLREHGVCVGIAGLYCLVAVFCGRGGDAGVT